MPADLLHLRCRSPPLCLSPVLDCLLPIPHPKGGLPGVPALTDFSTGDGFIKARITAPAIIEGYAITSYIVRTEPESKELTTTSKSITFAGLANGAEYKLFVAAVTKIGQGPFSDAFGPVIPGKASSLD